MPGDSGVTVVTMLVCLFYFACEAAGASSARHSLRPLNFGGSVSSGKTRAKGAARSRSCGCEACCCLKIESETRVSGRGAASPNRHCRTDPAIHLLRMNLFLKIDGYAGKPAYDECGCCE